MPEPRRCGVESVDARGSARHAVARTVPGCALQEWRANDEYFRAVLGHILMRCKTPLISAESTEFRRASINMFQAKKLNPLGKGHLPLYQMSANPT